MSSVKKIIAGFVASAAVAGGAVAVTSTAAGAADPAPTAHYSVVDSLMSASSRSAAATDDSAASIVRALAPTDGGIGNGPLTGDVRGTTIKKAGVSLTFATDGGTLCWSGSFTAQPSNIACTEASKMDPSLVSYQTISTPDTAWVVGVAPDGISTIGAVSNEGNRGTTLVTDNVFVIEVPTKTDIKSVSWTLADGSLKTQGG